MLRSYLKSFCEKSTIHGFAYIGHSKYHFVEKVFWIISLGISLLFTGSWIIELIGKLTRTPIVVAVDDTPIHVSEIYFPSMTICPGLCTMIDLVDYHNYVIGIKSGQVDLRNFTELDLEYLQVISLVTKDDFLSKFNVSISTENFIDRLSDFLNYFDVELIDRGSFQEKYYLNYTQVLSHNGFCFTFNFPTTQKFFKTSELSRNFFYNKSIMTSVFFNMKDRTFHDYPMSTLNSEIGIDAQLDFFRYHFDYYKPDHPTYFKTRNDEDGLHFTIHNPFEIISKSSPNYFGIFNQRTLFRIIPNIMRYDDSIAVFSPEQRGCYMEEERNLRYFKVYNKINCEHECLANLTLQICGCIQFFMVRNISTRICGILDSTCFNKVDQDFSITKSNCKCFNSCQRIEYDVEMKVINYHRELTTSSNVEVRFSSDEFYQFIYKRPYTFVDMIAFTGGLLGLFAGLSALSVIEVIYFFTLRLFLDLSNRKVHPSAPLLRQSAVKGFFRSFMEQTSVHGFVYIVSEDRKIKKLFWILAFGLSMYGCTLMASVSFKKFSLKAASIAQDSTPISIRQIPFPAITFTGDFENSYHYLRPSLLGPKLPCLKCLKEALGLRTTVEAPICTDKPMSMIMGPMKRYPFNYTRNSDFVDFLMNNITALSQKLWFDERNASFRGNSNPKYLEMLTVSGIGFSFNTESLIELLKIDQVSDDFVRITNLTRMQSSNQNEFSKVLNLKPEFKISLNNHSHLKLAHITSLCKKSAFFVHSPNQMPMNVPYKKFTKLLIGRSMEVLIKPEIIKSDDSIREMNIEDRKCYFADEYQLKYFNHYSKFHCNMEVLSQRTFEKCGCVPFNYIRNKTMEVCNILKWPCATGIIYFIDGDGSEESKHCLPLCDSISYDMELIVTRVAKNYSASSMEKVSLSFKFKETEVDVLKRYRQFPTIDFLSNIGGLLGLFAGVSFLTVLETFYLLIIRPITDLMKKFS